jgi:hypothetical protein
VLPPFVKSFTALNSILAPPEVPVLSQDENCPFPATRFSIDITPLAKST